MPLSFSKQSFLLAFGALQLLLNCWHWQHVLPLSTYLCEQTESQWGWNLDVLQTLLLAQETILMPDKPVKSPARAG